MEQNNNVQIGGQGAGPSRVGSSQLNQSGIIDQGAAAAAFVGGTFADYDAASASAGFSDYNAAGGVFSGYGAAFPASADGYFAPYGAASGGVFTDHNVESASDVFAGYGVAFPASADGSFAPNGGASGGVVFTDYNAESASDVFASYEAAFPASTNVSLASYGGASGGGVFTDDNAESADDVLAGFDSYGAGSSFQSVKGSKRHSTEQIDALKDYFKDHQHPNEQQRMELGRRIGLNLQQVTIWFQNKRSLLKKTQRERGEKEAVESENEKLRAQNEALLKENQKLRAQIEAQRRNTCLETSKKRKLPAVASNYPADSINVAAAFRQRVKHLAVSAAEELKVMANVAEPWRSQVSAEDATRGLIREASRHTATVSIHPEQLLNILMDVNEWSSIFSPIVAGALTLDILSRGEDYNTALQLMTAEYHIPVPWITKRECYFARYCTKYGAGVWIVVDVSIDGVLPIPGITTCQKRPSGCVIEDMSDGSSKVTWIENVYTENNDVSSTMCQGILQSGLGFGAKRWISILRLHCRRSAAAISSIVRPTDFSNLVMSSHPGGRIAILKLSERMVNNCFVGITGPKAGKWTELQGNFGENVKLMSRRVTDDPGLPHGTLLSGSTSFVLPIAPNMVFNFFSSNRSRREWDLSAKGNIYNPVHHTPFDGEAGSGVTVYEVLNKEKLVVQESWSDPVASHVVFARVENQAMNGIISGGDPYNVPLVPSGFTIFPVGPALGTEGSGSGGTLLTVSYQVLISKSPTVDVDAPAFQLAQFLRDRREKIKVALGAVGPDIGTSDTGTS